MEQISVTVDGATYHHTTESLANLIKEANSNKESLAYANAALSEYRQRISDICGNVYELFSSNYESGDAHVTVPIDDINELLEYMGADTLKKLWSATVQVNVTLNDIEASNQDEVDALIQDYLEVSWTSEGHMDVDDINVRDISEQ